MNYRNMTDEELIKAAGGRDSELVIELAKRLALALDEVSTLKDDLENATQA